MTNRSTKRTIAAPESVTGRPAELAILGSALCLQAAIYAIQLVAFYDTINWLTPTLVFFTLGWSCYRMAALNPLSIWTPLFWFRLACAVYYGIGPIVPLIADNEMSRSINSIYILSSEMLLKVNLVTLCGIFLVLSFSSLYIALVPEKLRLRLPSPHREAAPTMRFATYLLIIGGGIRYGLILPYVLGLTSFVLPGAVFALGKIYYAGIYLLIRSLSGNHQGRILSALFLIFVEIVASISSFSKTDLTLILVFSFMGVVENRRGLIVSLVGTITIAFVYFSFQPLVLYGRDRVVALYGSVNGAGMGERWGIIHEYLTNASQVHVSGYGSGLARLSYASANAFVIAQHDAGINGDTLRNAVAVFVPRAIWPDKPIISGLGEDLYFAVAGRYGSSMGVGHFAEAYWNFGWMGLLILMLPIGIILAVYSRTSLSIMSRQDWMLLPVVLMGVQIGLRVDGHFVPDVVGPVWMALVAWVALSLIGRLTSAKQRTR